MMPAIKVNAVMLPPEDSAPNRFAHPFVACSGKKLGRISRVAVMMMPAIIARALECACGMLTIAKRRIPCLLSGGVFAVKRKRVPGDCNGGEAGYYEILNGSMVFEFKISSMFAFTPSKLVPSTVLLRPSLSCARASIDKQTSSSPFW